MKPHIVFYQQYATPYFGVLSMAARLKNKGLKSDVVIDTLERRPTDTLKRIGPRLIGISCMSPEHTWLIQRTKTIRQTLPDAKIIVGGIHAIFYPQEILSETSADLVCNSEGEEVILKVVEELDKPRPAWESIQGLCFKRGSLIHCGERAALVPFDDKIVEDRDVYYNRYPGLARDKVHRFFSSRGCPYRCSFCYNANIQDVFAGKGRYVRQKSVENFIEEVASECEKRSVKSVFFYDDLFTFDKKWLKEFLELYKKRVGIQFMCTARADLLNEETVRMLAEAGCRTASFGIETGNYHIRSAVLKKDIADNAIIHSGNLLHKHGIKVQTANMFCLPDETVEDALRTVEINIKAKTDYAFSALFMPFPNTALADYCIEKGLLKSDYSLKDIPYSFLTSSILNMPKKEKRPIRNVHSLAYFFIKWPWTFKKFKNIIYLTFLHPLFSCVFLLGNLLRHKEERGISLWSAARYAWRMRKSF